jgi:hypothetical protein
MVTWLEARSCDDDDAKELETETMLRFPTLTEAMKVVENAASGAQRKVGYWEYSVKLANAETEEMASLFASTTAENDGKSERRTICLKYNGRCYSLTLFAFKE